MDSKSQTSDDFIDEFGRSCSSMEDQSDDKNNPPFPPCSSGHLPMPIYQENEVQTVIIKDIKQETSQQDAKDDNGIYRNCLVCGDNNIKCGSFIIAKIKLLFFWLSSRQIHWNWTSSL
jgi:hypothetical protein